MPRELTQARLDRRAAASPWVRSLLAEGYAGLEAMRLIKFRIPADLEHGRMDVALASSTKVYGSESAIEILRKLSEILGAGGLVRAGSAAGQLLGELEYELRGSVTLPFGGGANGVQRGLFPPLSEQVSVVLSLAMAIGRGRPRCKGSRL